MFKQNSFEMNELTKWTVKTHNYQLQ